MNASKIESELKKYLSGKVKFALLFGSVLTKYFRSESDVDLAIYWGRKLQVQEPLDFKEKLEKHFSYQYSFDIVSLDTADPVIAMQALAKGKVITKDDLKAYINYVIRMNCQYIDLKMDRKIIEKGLAKGSVYD